MKKIIAMWLIFTAVFIQKPVSLSAAIPHFTSGNFIKSTLLVVGERDIGEEGYSAPQVIDWDNDEKKDLIIGDKQGYIWFYKNQGTNKNPIFTIGVKLQNTHGDIKVNGYAAPYVTNWDEEKNLDLIVGDGQGKITLYRSLNDKNGAPILGTGTKISANGEDIDVGNYAAPFVTDWNNDSVKDLLVGNSVGNVLIFLGAGKDDNPDFNNYTALKIGTSTIGTLTIGRPVSPYVSFWDKDGEKDILLGDENGNVRLYSNISTLGTSTFVVDPKNYSLIKSNGIALDIGYDAKPVVVDWNSDNKKDLIVGDRYGQINLFLNVGQDDAPIFNTPYQLNINNENKGLKEGKNAAPFVCDWNNDHINDLMIGNELGNLRVYLGVENNRSFQFAYSSQIQLVVGTTGSTTVSTLDIGDNSSPVVLDWNSDGKKDILTGSSDGQLYLFLNTGTDEQPTFGSSTKIYIGSSSIPLDVGEDSRPYVVDWNKDGLNDLLLGNKVGEIYKCLNSGTNTKPVFNEKSLILKINGEFACPSLIYGDGDNKRDLIVGSKDGHIYFYKNTGADEDPQFDDSSPKQIIANDESLKVEGRAIPYIGDWDSDSINDLIVGIGNDSDTTPAGQIMVFSGLLTNTPPEVFVTTPTGTQTGKITIEYSLKDEESDNCGILVNYSTDNWLSWQTTTLSLQGGEPNSNLSSSPVGIAHTLVWDSNKDIPAAINNVWLQVISNDGKSASDQIVNDNNTAKFVVDNIGASSTNMILVGDEILDVGAYSKPHIVDWNGDGKMDLLIGNESGNVFVAINIQSGNTPKFSNISKIQHRIGTGSATQPVDVGFHASPFVLDWDRDGDNDLLVGNEAGKIFLYRNTNSNNTTPELGPKEEVTLSPMASGQISIFGINDQWNQSSPTRNLLVGDAAGNVSLFLNKGTGTVLSFGTGTKLHINPPIDVGNNAVPFWDDWNGNGKKDLIVGSQDGYVYLFVNYGTDTPLFFNPTKIEFDDKPVQSRLGFSAPIVYDWNFDGNNDILVGTKEGYVLFFPAGKGTNHSPKIEIDPIIGTQTGLIAFSYLLKDEDGNEVEGIPEFFIGEQWRSATITYNSGTNTITGLLSNAEGLRYTFVWDSYKDLPATETNVMFRIIPQDRIKGELGMVGTSNVVSFHLDNWNVLPQITAINISVDSGFVTVTYNLTDPDDSFATITVEYQGGTVGTGSWSVPTLTNPITRVSPGTHSFIWLSSIDQGGTSASNYYIRIIPYDKFGTGTIGTSSIFSIDNNKRNSSIIPGTSNLPIILTFPSAKLEIKEFESNSTPREDVVVSVRKVGATEVTVMNTLAALDNTIYEFNVDRRREGGEFKVAKAVITIPYDDLGSFETERNLRIYKLEQGKWVLASGTGGSPDMNKNEVSVEVSSFSIYRIGLFVPTISDFHVWPNPFKPTDGIKENGEFGAGKDYEFIIFSGVSDVKIYTMTSELARESIDSEIDNTGIWKWDAKNNEGQLVATGIYIYLITDKNGNSQSGRIAVIR